MINNAKKVAELLKVLANDNRLLILCNLENNPLNVSTLCEKIPSITQGALSQHLSILKANGIIDNKKNGLNVIYFIKDERIKEVIEVLKNNYCK